MQHSPDCGKSLKTSALELKGERIDSYDTCNTQGTLKQHVHHAEVSLYCFLHHGWSVLFLVFGLGKAGETDKLLVRKYGCKRQRTEEKRTILMFIFNFTFNYLYVYMSVYAWVCGAQKTNFRICFSASPKYRFHRLNSSVLA